jgi:glycosyltransferase involved in cell wall biosynthesis
MNLLHVVPHIDKEAAGPSYSVPRLCQSLAKRGNEVQLSCLAARGDIDGVRLDIHPQWKLFERFAVSSSLACSLARSAAVVDIVHNHSLWSMVNVAAGWVVPGRHAMLVTSPRGTLSAWALARSRRSKNLLWPLQRRALARADMLHATSEDEYQEIRALGLTAPVVIVPNGIDLPELQGLKRLNARGGESRRTLLFLSRIHPKKGIDRLLRAWAEIESRHPEWDLIIAGTGAAEHISAVISLAKELKLNRVAFPGPVYGERKLMAYQNAELFILPTHSENFGMVVAEALANGCPAVVSSGAPWHGLITEACGWWGENDVDSLVNILDIALAKPKVELGSMGERGRNWMERDYGWDTVGRKMESAYRWLLTGGERPDWVKVK